MITTCPYCSGKTREILSAPDVNRRVSDKIFHLRQCLGCGLNFLADPPADLGDYYTTDYHYIPKDRAELERHLPLQRFKIDLLRRFCSGGELLEIGPSIGQFCALAQEAGFSVHAIEMDAACVSFLRDELGIITYQSDDPQKVLRDLQHRFDAICLWHSLEHLPKFWEVLLEARAALKPGGIILIAAPNPVAFQAKVMGASWPHHDLPRHLFGISIEWLKTWCTRNQMRLEFATTRDAGSVYWNRFSWAIKFRSLAPQFSFLERVFWRIGLLFGSLWKPLEDREGVGACYTAILRLPDDGDANVSRKVPDVSG
ncbi:MAG: class I SAM-dependent methyltransferase [Roseomonas sp.]|nr:class I SAM-dependent methyltransferase [Roseomonas sp.]